MGELRRQVGSAYAIHDLLLFVSGCFCLLLVQTRKAKKQTVAKPAKTGKRMETKERTHEDCIRECTHRKARGPAKSFSIRRLNRRCNDHSLGKFKIKTVQSWDDIVP
jgi:hypothetical protein